MRPEDRPQTHLLLDTSFTKSLNSQEPGSKRIRVIMRLKVRPVLK